MMANYFAQFIACVLVLLGFGPGLTIAHSIDHSDRHGQSCSLFSELARELSPNASIITAGDPRMQTHQRWQAYSSPTYIIVVEVAVAEDVQHTIRFANKHFLPFLAVSGAHGLPSTLGSMQGGIAISFIKMKDIKISPSGKYAELQPGLISGEVARALWARGKETTTGICLCAGIMGVMLGGGHGYLQGVHGLATDQILEVNLVLANGTLVTASSESHPDLFWALRGAGHNFGVVTSIKYKIYDRTPIWSQVQLLFRGDKLEKIFELANSYVAPEDHEAELIFWYKFIRRPNIDPEPVISVDILYRGDLAEIEKYTSPFRAIGVLQEVQHPDLSYLDLFGLNGLDESGILCEKGRYHHLVGVLLKRHNSTALRTAYGIYNDLTTKYPDVGELSEFLIEGYSTQAALAVPFDSTATAFREYPLLLAPVWTFANITYSEDIITASKQIRDVLVQGSGEGKLSSYVNYASGDEALPEVYGHEPWRVKKLKQLKSEYDPEGRFNFYMPIV